MYMHRCHRYFAAIAACALCLMHQSVWVVHGSHNDPGHVNQSVLDSVGKDTAIDHVPVGSVPLSNTLEGPAAVSPPEDNSSSQVKSMLKNKTMMNRYMQSENLSGLSVIKGFCVDGLHCWPVQVFSITMMSLHAICTLVAFYLSSTLYSSGIKSAKFYQGGGGVFIGMSLLGLGIGAGASRVLEFGILKTITFIGPMMSIFASMVLIGRRGILLGAVGGICAGLPLGAMIKSHEVGISLGAIIGLLVGTILGVCPFFGSLDMNQRYMNKQNQFGSFSEPGSFSSDGYAGYQTVIKMSSTDFR